MTYLVVCLDNEHDEMSFDCDSYLIVNHKEEVYEAVKHYWNEDAIERVRIIPIKDVTRIQTTVTHSFVPVLTHLFNQAK